MPSLTTASQRLTTVSSLILERSRVLSLGLTPSPTTDTKIGRVLRQVRDELVTLGQGDGDGEDEWQRWESLVGMMQQDEMGRKQVAGLHRPEPVPPVESNYKDDEEEIPTDEETYRDHEPAQESPYRDTADPLIPREADDAHKQSFDSDLEAGTEQGLMMQHRSLIDGKPSLPAHPSSALLIPVPVKKTKTPASPN
ncbi:hypothetical protein NCC49_006083 [Naganishia albida]|nr:hypothetical protein NCC49_006083 [Naganishia albida]